MSNPFSNLPEPSHVAAARRARALNKLLESTLFVSHPVYELLPFDFTYNELVRLARFHLDYETGERPTDAELQQALPDLVAENPEEFLVKNKRLLLACDRLVSRDWAHYSPLRFCFRTSSDKREAKEFLLYRHHSCLFRYCMPSCMAARKLDVFVRLGRRRLSEDPTGRMQGDFEKGFIQGIPKWRSGHEATSVDWDNVSRHIRENAGPVVLAAKIISRLYDLEAPLHVFEQLLRTKPRLLKGKRYDELGYPGLQELGHACSRDTRVFHPALPARPDVYRLLLEYGAEADGLLYHAVRYVDVDSICAVAAKATQKALDNALRLHVDQNRCKSFECIISIALLLLRFGADPTKEADKVVNYKTDWREEPEKLDSVLDRCRHFSCLKRRENNRVVEWSMTLTNAIRVQSVMMSLCSASTVKRIGSDSPLAVLPVEMMRLIHAMLI